MQSKIYTCTILTILKYTHPSLILLTNPLTRSSSRWVGRIWGVYSSSIAPYIHRQRKKCNRMYAHKRTQFLTSCVIFKYMKNGTFMQRYPAFDVVRDTLLCCVVLAQGEQRCLPINVSQNKDVNCKFLLECDNVFKLQID